MGSLPSIYPAGQCKRMRRTHAEDELSPSWCVPPPGYSVHTICQLGALSLLRGDEPLRALARCAVHSADGL